MLLVQCIQSTVVSPVKNAKIRIAASTMFGLNKGSIIESVERLEKAGFDCIELVYDFDNFFGEEEVKKLKQKKIDFSMHCPFIGMMFAHPDENFARPQLELVERSLALAAELGCSHYVMHGANIPYTYTMLESPKSREYFISLFIKRFRPVFERYSKKGVKIVLENLSKPNEIGGQVSDIVTIQKELPQLGFCFDIAHANLLRQTDELLQKLKIDHVHATDNKGEKDSHAVIGSGSIDFKRILALLKQKDFNGKIVLESLTLDDTISSFNALKNLLTH
jgi:sugar phosphate isomerase/epimerase